MRAIYDDLLRMTRRRAVETIGNIDVNVLDLIAGWQAVVTATRHHLRWLRLELPTHDMPVKVPSAQDGPLYRLAQSIGVGADLLAVQNGSASVALDDEASLGAAGAEVATAVQVAARAILAQLGSGQVRENGLADLVYLQVTATVGDLDQLRRRDSVVVGPLGRVSTSLPAPGDDLPSTVMRLAAGWRMAHEATSPHLLLTRDLRSTTGQLRTLSGYVRHLAALLPYDSAELRALRAALAGADGAAVRVARCWRSRLSDVNGRSDSEAETAFFSVLDALRGWLRDGDRLRRRDEVSADERSAIRVVETIDEVIHAIHRVARIQQVGVPWLVTAGRLFVPRFELARRDVECQVRPTVWAMRYPQPHWVRTNRLDCFDELTDALADQVLQLSTASETARDMAGTSSQQRPQGSLLAPPPRPALNVVRAPHRPPVSDLALTSTPEAIGPER
jgi:hypothetical protein